MWCSITAPKVNYFPITACTEVYYSFYIEARTCCCWIFDNIQHMAQARIVHKLCKGTPAMLRLFHITKACQRLCRNPDNPDCTWAAPWAEGLKWTEVNTWKTLLMLWYCIWSNGPSEWSKVLCFYVTYKGKYLIFITTESEIFSAV